MATIKTDLICNLNQPVNVTYLHGNLFSQDNAGNTINVFVMDNGEPATIGGTVSANVIRSDGQTVAVSGAIEGNKAYVILPQACYAVPGVVHIIIKLTQSTTVTTIAAIVANVYMSTTDAVIDPGTVIPSIQALMALIEEAVDSIPTDYTGLLHTIAADYSSSKTYKVGDYAWESGVLKRCIVPITAAETYTAAHWTNAVIGDDLTNLKSAFKTYVTDRFNTYMPSNWFNSNAITYGELKKDGTITESSSRIYTDYIPVDRNSIIQCFRSNPIDTIYRRHIAVYDSNKNILPTYGSDNSSTGTYTISLLPNPDIPKFVRITVDATAIAANAIIVTDGTTPTAYTPYFDPYYEIADDFLTQESKTALDKLKDHELTTADLANSYSCALPKGYIFRQTVGLPESWYYASAVSPQTPVSISAGSGYSQKENDCISFPNTTALNSANGYTWNVYDSLLALIESDGQNVPYGMDRHIVTENLQDCSMLVIGDSTVDHDVMTQKMLDYFTSKNHTLTLLGTLGSGENKNEGRAGWKATDYLTNKQYDGVVNPFYNPATQTFDFSYYMTNQAYSVPDFVVIQLGINDLYNYSQTAIEPTWNAVKTMIDSIFSYNTGIKILLNLPTAPNSNQARHTVFLPKYINRVVKYNAYAMKQARALYGQSKVRPTYCHLILDPSTDISDNVHPTATGYEKMAKEVINQVNCWINNA